MTVIDVVLLSVIVLIGFKGFYEGFLHEVFGLIGVVAGVYFASRLALNVGSFFSENVYKIDSSTLLVILGFLVVLGLFWIGFLVLGFIFTRMVRLSGLGFLDRVLGYVFSCAKVFFILGFIFYGLESIKFIGQTNFVRDLSDKSKIYSAMIESAHVLVKFSTSSEIEAHLQKAANVLNPEKQNHSDETQAHKEPKSEPEDSNYKD